MPSLPNEKLVVRSPFIVRTVSLPSAIKSKFFEAPSVSYIRLLNVGVLNAATFMENPPEPETLPFWLPSRVPVNGVVREVSVYQL